MSYSGCMCRPIGKIYTPHDAAEKEMTALLSAVTGRGVGEGAMGDPSYIVALPSENKTQLVASAAVMDAARVRSNS